MTPFLLLDWLNSLIYEMAVRRLVFGRFAVSINGHRLHGQPWGEPVDRIRHTPAVEPKGATLTALKVEARDDGAWVAQCIVDVRVKEEAMDLSPLHQVSSWEWRLEPEEAIRVPAVPNACVDRSSNKWSKRSATEHKR